MKWTIGSRAIDTVTGVHGVVVRVNRNGLTIDQRARQEPLQSLGQRYYTWREAYDRLLVRHSDDLP